jgi:hypothetical protein
MIILNSNLTEADSRVRFFVIVHTADDKSCSVQNTKHDDERKKIPVCQRRATSMDAQFLSINFRQNDFLQFLI